MIIIFAHNSLIILYRTSMCFVLLPLHLFFIIEIVDWLSSNKIVGEFCGYPRLLRRPLHQIISFATRWVAINSAIVDESDVIFLFFWNCNYCTRFSSNVESTSSVRFGIFMRCIRCINSCIEDHSFGWSKLECKIFCPHKVSDDSVYFW